MLALGLTILIVLLRVLISPWIGGAGLVMFLPLSIIFAYLAGVVWAYAALAVQTVLIWFFILAPRGSFEVGRASSVLDLVLLVLASIGAIEFVRVLDRAFASLERERHRSAELAEQRQVLMTELTHRTSNNFQMVSAMLTLVRRTVSDPAAKKALGEASDRVTAMGIVQRQLANNSGEGVDLDSFLPPLCDELATALGVKVTYRRDHLAKITSRAASSLALIAQEFVANAAEHGKSAGVPLTVTVHVERLDEERAQLVVEDDGKGVPADFDPHQIDSLGLTLVGSFAQTLGGSFNIGNRRDGPGAIATAEFAIGKAASEGSDA